MEATMTLLPGDPPYAFPGMNAGSRDRDGRLAAARASAVPAQRSDPPEFRVIRHERIVRPNGDLHFHWWGDGRLSISDFSRTTQVRLSLRHTDALALLSFITGEDIPQASDTILDRVREAGFEAIGL